MTLKTLYICVLVIILFGFVSPAWATVDLDAYLPISGYPINPVYNFEKSFYINYPAGSMLQHLLENNNLTISFTDDANNNPDIKAFMQQINTNIATKEHSPATFTNLVVNYQFIKNGYPKYAFFDYKIKLTPTVTNYILNEGSGNIPTIIDASWLAFKANGTVAITTKQYGFLEINSPVGVIQSQLPDLYNVLKDTNAFQVFQSPYLIDASGLFSPQPLDKWNSLYYQNFTLTETAGIDHQGQELGVTTFSTGRSEGPGAPGILNNVDEDFTGSNGARYHVSTREQPNYGTIYVEGYANPNQVQGEWTFATTKLQVAELPTAKPSWYDMIPWWFWIPLAGIAVIGFVIFYDTRLKVKIK